MKKLSIAIVALFFAFVGCNNQQDGDTSETTPVQANPIEEFAKLNTFLKKFDEPSQTFKAPTDQQIKVNGRYGTIIHLNPADLETEDGQPIGKEVVIELKELTTRQQLLRANAQTVSEGQLLVSGGAYYINATSEGRQLRLKPGKEYSIEFPKLSEDEMSLYYGQRDSTGKMNWVEGNQKLGLFDSNANGLKEYSAVIITGQGRYADTATVPMKNMSKEENEKIQKQVRVSNMVYSPVSLNKFGWINCDRFFKPESKRTDVIFTFNNKIEDVNYANVYLIFEDIKSVMQTSCYFHNDTIEGNVFANIPVGMKVKILAVSYQHEKIFAMLSGEMSVQENHVEKITLKEMTEGEFDQLLKDINR
ncbi:hypothetical protein BH11BAC1_BH11BAC1_12250 [soil metagenome]